MVLGPLLRTGNIANRIVPNAYQIGPRRSRKPIRSKYLEPVCEDPHDSEEVLGDCGYAEPNEGLPQTIERPGTEKELPTAYRLDTNAWTSEQNADDHGELPDTENKQDEAQNSLPVYRYSTDNVGSVVDMIKAKASIPIMFEKALPSHAFNQPLGKTSDDTNGQYLEVAGFDLLDEGSYQATQGHFKLKAFAYCIGRNDLFEPLWDLHMVDKVEWVSSIWDADMVIHRRPFPGEKQFHYDQLRQEASSLGIPFVSINAPTVKELRKSLLPVFDLFAGKISPSDLDAKAGKGGKGGKGRRAQRIRL